MRLATFNLLHGRSLDDGRVDLRRLQAAVRSLSVDVLCLQEVDRWQPRSGRIDMTLEVAEGLGATDWRFAATLIGTPGGIWRAPADGPDPDAGMLGATPDGASSPPEGEPAYGIGLVSRLAVLDWRTVRLSPAPVRSPVLIPGTRRPVLLADEPRLGLIAVLDAPGGPVTVATTHLSFVPGWNARQLRRLTAALADEPHPVILLGDLNMPGSLPGIVSRWRQLARVPTYPAWQPRVQLDHVLARGAVPPPTRVEARPLPVSDHRALVVDVPFR